MRLHGCGLKLITHRQTYVAGKDWPVLDNWDSLFYKLCVRMGSKTVLSGEKANREPAP